MHDFQQSDVLAEESHSGRTWSLIVVLGVLGPAIGVALAPTTVGRWALTIVGILSIGTFAMTWSGFQYRFLRDGVEVRMLGIRLRWIPRESILSYSIEPWALIRGYGIRGIGRTRAYVWCNTVVHIKTSDGDIFLGHKEPQRIMRDLNMVTGFALQTGQLVP